MDSTNLTNERSFKLLEELYTKKDLSFDQTSALLSEFRILTREKHLRHDLLDGKSVETLVNLSAKYHTEAQKCLSNLILNYAHFREQIIEPYTDCVEKRFESVLSNNHEYNDDSHAERLYEVLYYDMRIIFLLSALCASSRTKIRDRLLDLILRLTEKEAYNFSSASSLLIIESLKTLFNLTLDKFMNRHSLAGSVITGLFAVIHAGYKTNEDEDSSKIEHSDQLLVNLIHLLTNMPEEVYLRLSYDDVNKILDHLDEQLKTYSKSNARDTVLPVLNVCANICKYNEGVREMWFRDIVGSVKDFEKRPEEYDTLRGRLVKLMTSVDVHLKDIAADFMYALCGSDTEKFITYTGFGNSAAFLSSRGLLGTGLRRESHDQKSSEQTDYYEIRDKIDPITGKIEIERKNPMEGMSEEEKEYHAHELATAITKLTNLGVVKQMSINPDTGEMKDILPTTSGNGDE